MALRCASCRTLPTAAGREGLIRGNLDLGFGMEATVGSGAGGLIREIVDSGVGADAAVVSGFMGMIRENVDLGFRAGQSGEPGGVA
jgi:hypothetical protein